MKPRTTRERVGIYSYGYIGMKVRHILYDGGRAQRTFAER